MKANIWNKVIEGSNGTVEMESGDHLSIAFRDKAGELQVVNVPVLGAVCVIEHEQTCDALVVRRNKAQFVAGGYKQAG
jgi:hypothetical protein